MKNLRRNPRGSRGFTLIEVLTTIAVMVLILPPIVSGFELSAKMAIRTRQRTEAAAIAQSRLEDYLAQNYAASMYMGTGQQTGTTSGDETPGVTHFRWQITTAQSNQAIAEQVTNVQEVTITVTWDLEMPVQHQLVLTSEMYIPGTTIQSTSGVGGITR